MNKNNSTELVFLFFCLTVLSYSSGMCLSPLFACTVFTYFFLLLLSALIVLVILRAVFQILLFHNRAAVVSVFVVKLSLPGNSR